jgi:hypothetical protein
MMTTPTTWRPTTGADSIPLPAVCYSEGPEADAAWAQYWRDCEEAANRETADEAIARCRAEAELFADGGQRFDHVLEVVLDTFDRQVVDLARPQGEKYRGLGLDECGFYGGWKVDRMRRAWDRMADAFGDLDRDRYRKAAAEFAGNLADLAVGMTTLPATPARAGGAA